MSYSPPSTHPQDFPAAFSVQAPGKLVIAGEYAVLYNAPAFVAAIDRQAIGTYTPYLYDHDSGNFDDHDGAARVSHAFSCRYAGQQGSNPVYILAMHDGAWIDGRIDGRMDGVMRKRYSVENTPDLALWLSVLKIMHDAGYPLEHLQKYRGHFVVDTQAFQDEKSGFKMGFGSSAAAAVVMTSLLFGVLYTPASIDANRTTIHALAHQAHLHFSGGSGSGIDVAASCYGGLTRFVRALTDQIPTCSAVQGSFGNVHVYIVWTGKSQNTRTFISAVKAFASEQPTQHEMLMHNIKTAATLLGEAYQRVNDMLLINSVHIAANAMDALGQEAGIDIVSAPHQQIRSIAQRYSGDAKPSGAGGGDAALCFVPAKTAAACVRALESAGFPTLPLVLSPTGVCVRS